ncbi:hypothetical protein [Methylopila turkensis]|nr:hypothetical protein [Methylopila turkensis]
MAVALNVDLRAIEHAVCAHNMRNRFAGLYKARKCVDRAEFWGDIVTTIGADQQINVLEFGVRQGRSMRYWSEHFKNPDTRFVGFDSFIGLPEDWTENLKTGSFSTRGKAPDIDDPRISYEIGWFQNMLPGAIARRQQQLAGSPLFVHLDADLYSATLYVLGVLANHFDEYYVAFDQFHLDENRALADFMTAYPFRVQFLSYTADKAGRCLAFGRMKKIWFEPGR